MIINPLAILTKSAPIANATATLSGVTTTNPHLEKALVIDEKKWRATNYLITLRKGLFRLSAAPGLDSPVHISLENIVYKDDKGVVQSLKDIYEQINDQVMKVKYKEDDSETSVS